MVERLRWPVLCLLLCAVPAFSQRIQVRRATMAPRAGVVGECVVEVEVGASAEVELFGDTGRLRTPGRSPASWRRFECTAALPADPAGFRFTGAFGKGHQELVADPRWNGGVAVVRLDNPAAGPSLQTFEVNWDADRRPDHGEPPGAAVCQDAVRARARGTFGYRDIRFYDVDSTYDQYPRYFISGTIEGRRAGQMNELRYTCALAGGRVESVDLQAVNGDAGYDGSLLSSAEEPFHGEDLLRRCESAVSATLAKRGYIGPDFRWSDTDDSRGAIEGALSVRHGSRDEALAFSCSMDEESGRVKSVDLRSP